MHVPRSSEVEVLEGGCRWARVDRQKALSKNPFQRTESLDKTLGIHRRPQTYFSVSTERKEKGEEEQEQEEEVVLEEAVLFQLAYVPQHRHYLLGKSFQLSWQIRSGPPFVPINWGFDVLVCVIAPWPHPPPPSCVTLRMCLYLSVPLSGAV